ncbi:MAG TPA: hypothetical protein VFT72_13770 [Opitutaceae bacterium]|nr:hypothetical protein [Opitutaceae bacterium]
MHAKLLSPSFWLIGILCGAASIFAQTGSDTAPSPTPRARDNLNSDSERPQRVSAEVSRSLTAGIKWEAPTPAPAKKADADEEDAADSEMDKPKNGIVRLPKYLIQGERPPVFTERDINTQKGLAALAVKRYLSNVHQNLNKYHLPGFLGGMSNEELAMQMYREEERLKNMHDMQETSYVLRKAGDTKEADAMKDLSNDMYMRRSEFSEPPSTSTTGR